MEHFNEEAGAVWMHRKGNVHDLAFTNGRGGSGAVSGTGAGAAAASASISAQRMVTAHSPSPAW